MKKKIIITLALMSTSCFGAPYKTTHDCARFGDFAGLKEKLKEISVNTKDKQGNTVLHCAVSLSPDLKIVKYLIEKGVAINAKNNIGKTALQLLVFHPEPEIVEFFLQKGANVNPEKVYYNSPLYGALLKYREFGLGEEDEKKKKMLKIIDLLLKYNAKIDGKTKELAKKTKDNKLIEKIIKREKEQKEKEQKEKEMKEKDVRERVGYVATQI